jgi:Centrosomal spindle body, CEP44
LRDEFSYKPKITKEQFFAKGFAERKCLMIMDVIKFCKTLHKDLSRNFKSSAASSVAGKRTPLKDQPQQQQDLRQSLSSSKPSPGRSCHSNYSDRSLLSESRIINPPSRFVSESFWKQSVAAMVPPVPTKKPFAFSQSIVDDSLIHYQPLELSDFDNPSVQDDISNISGTGKPSDNVFSQSFQTNNSKSSCSYQYLTKPYSPEQQVFVERNKVTKEATMSASTSRKNSNTLSSFDRSAQGHVCQKKSPSHARQTMSSLPNRSRSSSPANSRSASPTKSVSFLDPNASNLTTPKESPRRALVNVENLDNGISTMTMPMHSKNISLDAEQQISLVTVRTDRLILGTESSKGSRPKVGRYC